MFLIKITTQAHSNILQFPEIVSRRQTQVFSLNASSHKLTKLQCRILRKHEW